MSRPAIVWPCERCGAPVVCEPMSESYGDANGWDYDLVEYDGECDRRQSPPFKGGCGADVSVKIREPMEELTE